MKEVNFTGLLATTNTPSQVQVVFSLRDQEGHAIVLPAGQVEEGLKVSESGEGTDGSWEEVDYTETSFFVHSAENIDLEIVFVLDFTNSMSAARLSGGVNGIEAMLDAFDASLAVLRSAHRVGVVEFHDRNLTPTVLSPLTTDRKAIRCRVAEFARSGFDPGSSRVWDSLTIASKLFSSLEDNPRAVRALVFLSDGRDTSSDNTLKEVELHAELAGVQLYPVGVGNVYQESDLHSAAETTGGAYYSAHDLNLIQEQLQLLVNDLRGQYQLTYITLRRTGEYRVGISIDLAEVRGETEVGPFEVASFFGADNQGVIDFDPPSVDWTNQVATLYMRALHVPRNVDHLRLRARTLTPLTVELVPQRDGGLLEGWRLSGPDPDGWYEASSGDPLEFGSLGLLAKLVLSDIPDEGAGITIEFDNSIYTGGKSLSNTRHVFVGDLVGDAGQRIAFHSDRDGPDPTDDDRIWNIYAMNADGSDVNRLTSNRANDFSPDWSPDGQRIAFHSNRDDPDPNDDHRVYNIYVMNADGTGVTRLTYNEASDFSPDWSPDGDLIAFVSNRDDPDLNDNERVYSVYVMNVDGSGAMRLSPGGASDFSPNWSPDGRRIAFHSTRDGNSDIYVMDVDGSGVTRLTDHEAYDSNPDWSPDGRRMVFRSSRDDPDPGDFVLVRNIYVMNADGSQVTRLTDNEASDGGPSW